MNLINILTLSSCFISVFSFVYPVIYFIKCFHNQMPFNKIPVMLLSVINLNTLVFLSYASFLNQFNLYVSYGFGLVITSLWLLLWIVLNSNSKVIPSLTQSIILFSIIGELFYVINTLIASKGLIAFGMTILATSTMKSLGIFIHIAKKVTARHSRREDACYILSELLNSICLLGYGGLMMNCYMIVSQCISLGLFMVLLGKIIQPRKGRWFEKEGNVDSNLSNAEQEIIIDENAFNGIIIVKT